MTGQARSPCRRYAIPHCVIPPPVGAPRFIGSADDRASLCRSASLMACVVTVKVATSLRLEAPWSFGRPTVVGLPGRGAVNRVPRRAGGRWRRRPCGLQALCSPPGPDGTEPAHSGAELGFRSKDALSASTVMVRSLMANRRQIGVPSRHTPYATSLPRWRTNVSLSLEGCRW